MSSPSVASSNTDSRELLQKFLAGDHAAFRELVERHLPLALGVALRRTGGDEALAHDVAQIVFSDLVRHAARMPASLPVEGWLYRHAGFVTNKLLRGDRRRLARERTVVQLLHDAENMNHRQTDRAVELDEALQALRERDRHAIILRFFNECSLESVGHQLGISTDAAQKRVERALAKLRERLTTSRPALTAAALLILLQQSAEAGGRSALGISQGVAQHALRSSLRGFVRSSFFWLRYRPVWQSAAIGAAAGLLVMLPIVAVNSTNITTRAVPQSTEMVASSPPQTPVAPPTRLAKEDALEALLEIYRHGGYSIADSVQARALLTTFASTDLKLILDAARSKLSVRASELLIEKVSDVWSVRDPERWMKMVVQSMPPQSQARLTRYAWPHWLLQNEQEAAAWLENPENFARVSPQLLTSWREQRAARLGYTDIPAALALCAKLDRASQMRVAVHWAALYSTKPKWQNFLDAVDALEPGSAKEDLRLAMTSAVELIAKVPKDSPLLLQQVSDSNINPE